MSDSIQSISQGNYILQGTVATSAGIVGDGSTQNPLRADETVLWSGTNSTGNLSESIENFNEIKVNYITDDGIQGTEEFLPSIGKTITLDSMYVATNSAVWFKATNYTFSANTSFKSYPMQLYVNNSRISGAWYNNTDNIAFRLTRVVGINRISANNA